MSDVACPRCGQDLSDCDPFTHAQGCRAVPPALDLDAMAYTLAQLGTSMTTMGQAVAQVASNAGTVFGELFTTYATAIATEQRLREVAYTAARLSPAPTLGMVEVALKLAEDGMDATDALEAAARITGEL